tara:strand:+ start:151 stop:645 length:495 start_codon:yes stop_codon:yes gene_type:complete
MTSNFEKDQLDQLRKIIREFVSVNDSGPGAAGIAVVKKFDDGWKILGLMSSKKKHLGMYDLTKGMIDSGESQFEAAVRETYEEAGIKPKDLNFQWGRKSFSCNNNNICLYIASTKAEPYIVENPKTGHLEHTSADWLSLDQFEKECIGYLKPVANWVRGIVNKS